MSERFSQDEAKHWLSRAAEYERQLTECEIECRELKRRLAEIEDIPLARRQVGPDGVVPGNTVECAHLWHAEANRLSDALTSSRLRVKQLEEKLDAD